MTRIYCPGQKRELLIGMGMTEKQGGSDVLSNTTQAERLVDGSYRLVGHSGFSPCRKAMPIWCWPGKGRHPAFLYRDFLPDGQRNAIRLERLKDKLGNRSNASCEVEPTMRLAGYWAKKGGYPTYPEDGRDDAF